MMLFKNPLRLPFWSSVQSFLVNTYISCTKSMCYVCESVMYQFSDARLFHTLYLWNWGYILQLIAFCDWCGPVNFFQRRFEFVFASQLRALSTPNHFKINSWLLFEIICLMRPGSVNSHRKLALILSGLWFRFSKGLFLFCFVLFYLFT